jgi:hypothetical protein
MGVGSRTAGGGGFGVLGVESEARTLLVNIVSNGGGWRLFILESIILSSIINENKPGAAL